MMKRTKDYLRASHPEEDDDDDADEDCGKKRQKCSSEM